MNGKPGDHPFTDITIHGLHPYPEDLERMVITLDRMRPGFGGELESAPLDWAKGKHLQHARSLLNGLITNHGDPYACRHLIHAYFAAVRGAE